jgi:hypothetical protein
MATPLPLVIPALISFGITHFYTLSPAALIDPILAPRVGMCNLNIDRKLNIGPNVGSGIIIDLH